MRTLTMTAMALALAVTATSADAGQKHQPKPDMWINKLQGMGGDLNLKYVMPHTIVVGPKYKIIKAPHLDTPNKVEIGQLNKGDLDATLKLNSFGPADVTGTAAAVGNSVNIETTTGVHVEGNQANFGDATADLNGGTRYYRSHGYAVPASVVGATNVELTAAAIGNSVNVDTDGDVQARLFQINTGDMDAALSAEVTPGFYYFYKHQMKDVDLTAAAVGNSINLESGGSAVVGAHQINAPGSRHYGRSVELDASLRAHIVAGSGRDVTTTAAGVGNSFSLEFADNYDVAIASIEQENFGDARAINKTIVKGKFKTLDATAAAIGNSINISNVLDDN